MASSPRTCIIRSRIHPSLYLTIAHTSQPCALLVAEMSPICYPSRRAIALTPIINDHQELMTKSKQKKKASPSSHLEFTAGMEAAGLGGVCIYSFFSFPSSGRRKLSLGRAASLQRRLVTAAVVVWRTLSLSLSLSLRVCVRVRECAKQALIDEE